MPRSGANASLSYFEPDESIIVVDNLSKALKDDALIVERKLNISNIKFRLILVSLLIK